jgi:hypothetical protein
VVAGIRMPSETILPNVGGNGRYKDVAQAHFQFDVMTGMKKAIFPLWQLTLARFDPDNFDDMGSLGRPFLDASRSTWRKLLMTEEDLVIRRRTRAPQRFSHVLEGASKDELEDYRKLVEGRQGDINTDFYSNKKGGVTALQGDAALNQIEDVSLLLDAFFSGSPLPKGLMGYTTGMARDIFADLKEDYFDEIDVIQDTLAWIYDFGFRLDLMLAGINPDDVDYEIKHAERRTETPNQAADRGLKWRALGLPYGMVWEQLGLNPADVRARLEYEKDNYDPYPYPQVTGGSPGQGAPGDGAGGGNGTVKITPGNAPKGESATNVPNDVNRLAEEAA